MDQTDQRLFWLEILEWSIDVKNHPPFLRLQKSWNGLHLLGHMHVHPYLAGASRIVFELREESIDVPSDLSCRKCMSPSWWMMNPKRSEGSSIDFDKKIDDLQLVASQGLKQKSTSRGALFRSALLTDVESQQRGWKKIQFSSQLTQVSIWPKAAFFPPLETWPPESSGWKPATLKIAAAELGRSDVPKGDLKGKVFPNTPIGKKRKGVFNSFEYLLEPP